MEVSRHFKCCSVFESFMLIASLVFSLIFSEANVSNGFWDLLQMAVTIFCCCAPIYKTILPPTSLWTRFKTSLTSLGSTTRLNHRSKGRKKLSEDSSGPQGVSGSQLSTSAMWPRFQNGTGTQYTWAEAEIKTMDEISLQRHESRVNKTVESQRDIDIV